MRRILVLIVAAIVLIIGGFAVAYASIPHSSTGVISACHKTNGDLTKVIDVEAGQTCPVGQTQLDWNQIGPVGPPGMSDLEEVIVTLPFTSLQPENETEGNAICPGGKVAISGGFDSIGDLTVRAFFRRTSGDGWFLLVRNDTDAPVAVFTRVRVLCATIL